MFKFDPQHVKSPLQKEFLEFCLTQPDQRLIDHDTWESCALGDFARECGYKRIDMDWNGFAYEAIPKVFHNALDYAKRYGAYPTYGELARAIKAQCVLLSD